MLRPAYYLDPSWLEEKTVVVTREKQRPLRRPHAYEARPTDPPRQDTSHGVPRATPTIEDEDS